MIEDGGPAFPSVARDGNWQPKCDGMSLRDYFAAKAMAGMLNGEDSPNFINGIPKPAEKWNAMLAKFAYAISDAMLAERSKK
jgi:hypothetical protein